MAKGQISQLSSTFAFRLNEVFRGYNSANDKTKLGPGFLFRGSKNVYKKKSGTLASRPGLLRRGSADTTDAGVKSDFVWNTNVGTVRPLRVCNNKLQVESDIVTTGTRVWYDLLETSTLLSPALSLTRFVFDTWWNDDEKTDRVIMARGDTKISHWSGGIAKYSSALASGTGGLQDASVGAAGTGYVVGDILTINGGSLATVRVTSIGTSGTVTGVEVYRRGSGLVAGNVGGTFSTTGGTGSSCTITIVSIGDYSTLTKTDTSTWAELGFATNLYGEKRIIINGIEFSYTHGEDTTILQGVIGNISSLTLNMVIIQAVIVGTADITDFDFDFIKTDNNQVWAGSYSSRIVYKSADINSNGVLGFLNYSDTTTSIVIGDPDHVILDDQCAGIGVKDGKIILFAGNSYMYVITPNQNVTYSYNNSSNNAVYNFQKIEKKQLPVLSAALAHEFIDNFGEYLVWVDQNNQLRALGTFSTVDTVKPTTLSADVETELSEDDFTDGHLKVIDDIIHITSPNNGRDWMYNIRESINSNGQIVSEKYWDPPQIRGISRFCVISGVVHGHSNTNPQIYQIWDTGQYHDDSPSDEPISFAWRMRFSYEHLTSDEKLYRYSLLTFDKVFYEGYMPEGAIVNTKIFFDYQGSTDMKEIILSDGTDLATFFQNSSGASLGDSPLGDNPLGDGIIAEGNDQELLAKFRAITDVSQPRPSFEFSIEIYSEEEDARFELLCFGANIRAATQQPTYLRK